MGLDRQITVFIPTVWKNGMVLDLIHELNVQGQYDHLYIMNNSPSGDVPPAVEGLTVPRFEVGNYAGYKIYEMWNAALALGMQETRPVDECYIAILNDDISIGPNFLEHLASVLDSDERFWAVCANYDQRHLEEPARFVRGTFKDGGFAGFAFMVRKSAFTKGGMPVFDENYNWWFGDDDFVHSLEKLGHPPVMARDAHVRHIGGGSNTVVQYTDEFNAMVDKDREYYMRKWHNG